MNEQFKPNQERNPRLSDEELVERSLARAEAAEQPIDDATARVIASMIHAGQASAMYTLASSGAIYPRHLEMEFRVEAEFAERNDAQEIARWVTRLREYVEARDDHAPVEGWSNLWLQQPEYEDTGLDDENCCTECGEHFANPHHPTCSRSPEDFPEEDDSFQSAPAEDNPRAELEAAIQVKLGHISTGNLVRRMEKAQDFSTDDEEIELTRRLREQGKAWRWSESFTYPQVIIFDLPEEEGR
ncbi:hypothetical protein G3I13_01915 [Streptomyces sp. SID6673]|nr:hypothetical protein [Streptomyces sp. SID11726]NDZ94917.1 hypothetical protein [Streptomyces sp. SID11726]NEB23077.1 hypothetical protein [Streptomyces sp. SID6673]